MSRFKLFEEYFQSLNEGAIQVYPPNSPFTKEGSIQWTGVEKLFTQGIPQRKQGPWLDDTTMTVILDLNDKDYDKYIADASYNSIPLKNQDKKLPIFSVEKPKYDESEFYLQQLNKSYFIQYVFFSIIPIFKTIRIFFIQSSAFFKF